MRKLTTKSLKYFLLSLGIASSVLVGSCDDNISPFGTGRVQFQITGLGAGVATAGTATIKGTGVDMTAVIPAPTGQVDVPPGTYTVTYTPPPSYVLAPGQSATHTVVVTANNVTQVSIAVIPAGTATGTLNVMVNGLASTASAGGTVVATRTDVAGTPVTVNVPASGTASQALEAGAYSVAYTPPTGHGLATGQAAVRSVTIVASQTATVTYVVTTSTAANGTLSISVSGVTAGSANGGAASVLRTDLASQTPTSVVIPASGTTTMSVAAGTYTVTYTPPANHVLASGQTNPQQATIAAGQTRSVSFAVTATSTGGTQGVVFHSDFSTALGTGTAAWLDTSKPVPWDVIGGSGRGNEVVPSTGLDFPTTNVLRVVATARSGGGANSQSHRLEFERRHIPIPPIGGSIYYRWYQRVMIPDRYTADDQTHPIQDGVAGSDTNWLMRIQTNSNGTYNMRFDVDATSANAFPNSHFGNNLLFTKGQTYRVELQIHRIGEATFNMHARVYDAAGTLLFDDDDFRNGANTGSLADRPTLRFNVIQHLQGFQVGFNGLNQGAASEFPFTLYYQGGVCIRTDTWCGPYSGGI